MAINFVSDADQGYQKREGNLLDAATSALALYNLPQSMKLQMQRQQLQNQGLGLANTGTGIANQQAGRNLQWDIGAHLAPQNIQNDITQPYQGQPTTAPRQMAPSSTGTNTNATSPHASSVVADADALDNGETPFLGFGKFSLNNPGPSEWANANENSSNGGVSNDLAVKGTSAEEMKFMSPYAPLPQSILSQSQAHATSGGLPNNAPAMANGTSARGNSMLPPTIPGSTQGGGPASSPFSSPPFSSKGISFNSGETADNSSSMPREDSQGGLPSIASADDHAALPVGARYKDPMGNIRRKLGAPSASALA